MPSNPISFVGKQHVAVAAGHAILVSGLGAHRTRLREAKPRQKLNRNESWICRQVPRHRLLDSGIEHSEVPLAAAGVNGWPGCN
jgi:hypothetical protein